MEFLCDGGGSWTLDEKRLGIWRDLYPDLNVDQECRKAWAWLDANPMKRKTARGMPRFLVAWLNRAQPAPPETRADRYGHYPRCRTMQECTLKALAEARAKRTT